jgi:tetratricopeptide (TPR) repeat protein
LCVASLLFLAGLAAPIKSSAQTPANVLLESNEQLFTILAARIAAGVDPGSSAEAGREVRNLVRSFLAKKNPAVLPELRKFFAEHEAGRDPVANLGQYVSLALLVGPPPNFRLTVAKNDLPPDAKALVGLLPLLKDFSEQANLIDLWAQLQSLQQKEIEAYSPPVRTAIQLADAYLRFPSGAYLGRTYTIYVSLLGIPEQVQARIYGQNYYIVVTPSKDLKVAEIRHQYLHFLLDPLAVKYATEIKQKSELRLVAREAPQLGTDFKDDFGLLLTECLIRATELRMDKRPAPEVEKNLQEMVASGLILAPYFYSALIEYEKQEASMFYACKDILAKIDPAQEKAKLANVKFAPVEQPPPGAQPPPASEEERLLNQAENLIYEGRYSDARVAFKSILENVNAKSERALFGLAVVASNTRKPDLAEDLFHRTLDAAHDLRIVTWSHIYLGRIYDLKGNRQGALEQYRAASLTSGSYPDAQRAVESGLQHPFGMPEHGPRRTEPEQP